MNRILEKLDFLGEGLDLEKMQVALDFADSNEIDYKKLIDLLLPMQPDEDTIIAAIILDVYLLNKISDATVREKFGDVVARLVSFVKKLENLTYNRADETSSVEVLRKMFMAMAKDIRVVVIDLAYKLCKMQYYVGNMEEKEQKLFAREILDLYVPIADRLGVYNMKTRLEDFAFQYSDPFAYNVISSQLKELEKSCDVSINLIKQKLDEFFRTQKVDATVFGRIKSHYSIFKKLKRKGLDSVSDLYDIFAIRIILPMEYDVHGERELNHLYAILGMLHSEWKPISKRFKDYIAVPKPNGYRSLHTVVLGLAPKDLVQPVEIQIRDQQMDKDAEYGIASHWIYKESPEKTSDMESKIEWLKGLERFHQDFTLDSGLREIPVDIFDDRIFVLTPRGRVVDLPVGSCPLDFAYSIHTDVGNRCVMAKVDGRTVSLDYSLKNGEVVEIVTSKDGVPKLQWLSVVKTGFAKSKIKAWFSSLNRDNNLKEGKNLINAQLARIGKPKLDQKYSVLKKYLGRDLPLVQRERIIEEVGTGAKLASDVIRKIFPYEEILVDNVVLPKISDKRDFSGLEESLILEEQVLVGGEGGLPIKLAPCCNPKMGQRIVGYVTRGKSITIHQLGCDGLNALESERIISACWKGGGESTDDTRYRVCLKLLCVSRLGMIRDISSTVSDLDVDIVDVRIRKTSGGLYEECFLLDLPDLNKFDSLVDKLEKLDGILKVTKEKTFESEVM